MAVICFGARTITFKKLFLLTPGLSRIILLIWGSFIPSIYYGFAEDMEWVRVYWSMVSCFLRFLFWAFLPALS